MDIEMEACVALLQATVDEIAGAGADRGTIAKALLEVIAQLADEDRIGAEVFLETVAELLDDKIDDAALWGELYEIKRYVAQQKKPKRKSRKKK